MSQKKAFQNVDDREGGVQDWKKGYKASGRD